ncbi:ExeM/NucH family extracellular endonuclease [Clavibacter capsici]|uniref:ExeM/NucH family extracellular endonuclease n=1 Tax=Clavibacter capsici TaxID=1874630 RepID=A0AAE6XPK1_9MICO|nr:ExeM/NucH family extracellular endonuclease [Clavibacter capsici]ALD14078.1 nuclease [Clavibacter capsici]QIS44224.1 ExeM/NucH family extracellular endonuclease [Clavibacter capsici]
MTETDTAAASGSRERRPGSARRVARPLAVATALALGLSALVAAPAEAVTVSIADVQGTGSATPFAGKAVTVEGVVTADYRGASGYAGLVIQTAGSGGPTDATPGASDAVFVYLGSQDPAVAIGDLVRVTGTASERQGQTQVSATATDLVQAAVGVPAATPLPDTLRGADRESLESMLVTPTGDYRVGSAHQLETYGTLWLSAGAELPVKATDVVRPGAEADRIAADNRARRLLLDDGYNIQLTNAAYPAGATQPYYTADRVVRNGDVPVFPSTPYVLAFGFDDWRLQPTTPLTSLDAAGRVPTFTAGNPRPASSPEVGGDVRIAGFNVLNYFTTLGERGARTAEEFQRQRAKIVTAITGLDAQVVTLMEIENSTRFGEPADTATADLVRGLNDAAGKRVWDYVRTPAVLATTPTDEIQNAIIYRTDAVTPVGASATQVDETVWGNAREPIAQSFRGADRTFTVVANHLKSKSGSGTQPADGQGFFNADRVAQAKAVARFASELQVSSGSDLLYLLGDFNAYSEEDPIQVLRDAGFVDLVPAKAPGERTYSFDGEVGSLDHVLATGAGAARVTGVGVWDVNAPEWAEREYGGAATDGSSAFRSSDHDPVKVGLDTIRDPSTLVGYADRLLVRSGQPVRYTVKLAAGGATAPTGRVQVLDRGRAIASVDLTAADAGRATVTLPRLSRGIHLLTASYAGGDEAKASSSVWPSIVLVW